MWDYINHFAEFNAFVNSPIAVFDDEIYNLLFNMNTFSRMWGIKTPAEAKVIFGRRLGEYQYYNMDKAIKAALTVVLKLERK